MLDQACLSSFLAVLCNSDDQINLIRVFNWSSALPEHTQVFSAVKDLVGQLLKEDWDHLFIVSVSLLPIAIVEIFLNIVLILAHVFNNQEFTVWVFQFCLIDPLLKNLQEGN